MFIIELLDIILGFDGHLIIGAKQTAFHFFLTPIFWFFIWAIGIRVQSKYWIAEISNVGQFANVSTRKIFGWMVVFFGWTVFLMVIIVPIFHLVIVPLLFKMAYAIA